MIVWGRNLSESCVTCCQLMFFASIVFISVFGFYIVLSCSRYGELPMDFNSLFFQRQEWKRISQKLRKLFFNTIFQIFIKNLKLCLFLYFYNIFNIPTWCKDTSFIGVGLINWLSNFFMLEVECLNWPCNKVITSYPLLHILSVVLVCDLTSIIILLETWWWQIKCKNGFCFLKLNWNICL